MAKALDTPMTTTPMPRLVKAKESGTHSQATLAISDPANPLSATPTPEAAPAASPCPAIPTSKVETHRTATGVVVRILPDRGFAFIADAATEGPWAGIEYFLHRSMVGHEGFNALQQGARVRFDAVFSTKGWRAVRVTRLLAPGGCLIMAKDRRTSEKSPHAQDNNRERTRQSRAALQREVIQDLRVTVGIRIARRPLAYAWQDPQELAGLVEDQYLARWSAPEMPR